MTQRRLVLRRNLKAPEVEPEHPSPSAALHARLEAMGMAPAPEAEMHEIDPEAFVTLEFAQVPMFHQFRINGTTTLCEKTGTSSYRLVVEDDYRYIEPATPVLVFERERRIILNAQIAGQGISARRGVQPAAPPVPNPRMPGPIRFVPPQSPEEVDRATLRRMRFSQLRVEDLFTFMRDGPWFRKTSTTTSTRVVGAGRRSINTDAEDTVFVQSDLWSQRFNDAWSGPSLRSIFGNN